MKKEGRKKEERKKKKNKKKEKEEGNIGFRLLLTDYVIFSLQSFAGTGYK